MNYPIKDVHENKLKNETESNICIEEMPKGKHRICSPSDKIMEYQIRQTELRRYIFGGEPLQAMYAAGYKDLLSLIVL